jgi:ABC-type transporter Mla MlaB component
MLRITAEVEDGKPTLKLEGSVTGPWVSELRRVVEGSQTRSGRVRLDLSEVRYVDAEGAALLRELMRDHADLSRRSTFVAELLEGGSR